MNEADKYDDSYGYVQQMVRKQMGDKAYYRMKRVEKLERMRKTLDADGSSNRRITFSIGPSSDFAGVRYHERKPDGSWEITDVPEDPRLLDQWPSDALIARVYLLLE